MAGYIIFPPPKVLCGIPPFSNIPLLRPGGLNLLSVNVSPPIYGDRAVYVVVGPPRPV